jgi:hypothetical protein
MSAESDVKMVPGQVVVDAWDLCLDNPDRRPNPQANPNPDPNVSRRRALVHDFEDGLTINWDHDYPGGVILNGVKAIDGHGEGQNKKTEFKDTVNFNKTTEFKDTVNFRGDRVDCLTKLRFVASAVRWTEVSTENAEDLVIESKGGFGEPGKIMFKSPVRFQHTLALSKLLGPALVEIPDLVGEILSLRKRISDLEQKVQNL